MSKKQDMSLPSFVESMRAEAEDFEAYWQRCHTGDSKRFPWMMPLGEWSAQMAAWQNAVMRDEAGGPA